ncbi:hypothetical protein TrST_g14014 [Triparma strigata]|uniref:Major facilitator superfamily (MFS) profile domain-containing protein n=1 Tax=Triparma strigata TaxID=1606541 RepID=A0A9W7AM72_9STRA|nr:hypothetical protein TrST_g14014 [Triparma strigata]
MDSKDVLLTLFAIDTIAVSLVIPFLPQYYTLLPFSPSTLEYISSLYNISQILGAFFLSKASDAGVARRREILQNGFLSSSTSYGIIFIVVLLSSSNVDDVKTKVSPYVLMSLICFSRLLVGFFKQTYTLTTTILTSSNSESRSKIIGQVSAILTSGWIIGPSVGSWISGRVWLLICMFYLNRVSSSNAVTPV